MNIIQTPAYQKAFILYLRKGIAPEVSLKADELGGTSERHATTHYIWHTQGDSKVRASHAANNGRIFAWNNPPPTGHPGEDYNCRCWAEPINAREYANQLLISSVTDQKRWTNEDFVNHYRHGNGRTISLQ